MKKMDNLELEGITGGASPWIAVAIAAAVVFIAGVIEGIVHPNTCQS